MTAQRLARGVAGVLAAMSVASACGVPTAGDMQRVNPSSVPFGLLSSQSGSGGPVRERGPTTSVFFVSGARLATVARHVVGENVPAEAVRLVLAGPTPVEAARGLTSDVPAGTRLISLDLTGPVATVDLNSQFGAIGGSEQVLAVAQLVYTLTASRYIDAVRFAINGTRIEVPDGSGSLSAQPRRRQDYRQVAAARR